MRLYEKQRSLLFLGQGLKRQDLFVFIFNIFNM